MDLHILLPVILIPAKLLEEGMRRARLPALIGTIFAGIVLGPSILGLIPTQENDPTGYKMVHQLAQIGLCVLLFSIGLETRLKEFLPVWRPATSIAISGMVFPFGLGWLLATFWGWPQQSALFVGAALTATSIGITATVLSELGVQKSKEGILILGSAILDDVLGLLLLMTLVAVVTPAVSAMEQLLIAVLQAIAFLAVGIFIGPHIVHGVILLSRWSRGTGILLVLAFSYLLVMAYTARAVGLDMIIGAYAAGLAFARHPERFQIEQDLKPLTELLTPLFFVMLGASIEFSGFNLQSETGIQIWSFTVLLFMVAVIGKLFSAFGVRNLQINKWVVGSGMMPRGEVGLVFANIGLLAGIFSSELFSSIVVVLIATSILGPVLLRAFWKSGTRQVSTGD